MIGGAVDVELARQQWEDGRRRFERTAADSPHARRLGGEIELILAELRRRVGQTFTLAELAATYDGAAEWARDVLFEARPENASPPDTSTVTDAAFQRYARGAIDYRP
jgi:hypothetical protein